MEHEAYPPDEESLDDARNRRQSPRRPASDIPDLKARLLAGAEVRLVDVSKRGVLLETDARLLPGSVISVKFLTRDATLVMKGCVVRSSVTIVASQGVVYRTAVAFDDDIKLCDESLWVDEAPQVRPVTVDDDSPVRLVHSTEPLSDYLTHSDPLPPPASTQPTTVTTVFASSSDDLRALLVANDW